MTEELINLQAQTFLPREGVKLLIIRIGGYLRNGLDAQLAESHKETDQKRTGILETTGINKLNTVEFAIVIDTAVVYTLTKACHKPCTIVLNDLVIDIAAAMALGVKIIIAEMDFIAIFTQALHLIMNLLTDATHFRKSVIDEEQYLHFHYFAAKVGKNLELNKIICIFVVVNEVMT